MKAFIVVERRVARLRHFSEADMRAIIWLSISLACALHAYPQSDSHSLQSAFGPPIKRFETPPKEVFAALPGIPLTASYSPDHKLCELEIPSGIASKKQVDEILEKAVPSAGRGKQWNAPEMMVGIGGVETRYYEKLIIQEEIFTRRAINKNPGATVLFKRSACGWKPGKDPFDTPPTAQAQRYRPQQ